MVASTAGERQANTRVAPHNGYNHDDNYHKLDNDYHRDDGGDSDDNKPRGERGTVFAAKHLHSVGV